MFFQSKKTDRIFTKIKKKRIGTDRIFFQSEKRIEYLKKSNIGTDRISENADPTHLCFAFTSV